MRFPKIALIFVSFTLFLSACSGLPVEKVPLEHPEIAAEGAQPLPIGFNKIVFALPTGTPTVSSSPKGLFGLLACEWPYGLTSQGSVRGRGFPTDGLREVFFSVLEGQGYDVTGNPGRLFDEAEDMQRSIYSIGGRITDIKIDTCNHTSLWGVPRGKSGEGHIEVEWSAFDLINRKTVFKKTTKGFGKLRTPNFEGVQLLFEEALAAAVHNLGADAQFHNLVFYGELPNYTPPHYEDPYEMPDQYFLSKEPVSITQGAQYSNPAKGRFKSINDSVVLLQKAGHGSGFYISSEGHILTNAHVVGNADRMRIVTSRKAEKLIADVLRIDRKRDVALLKLQKLPNNRPVKPLPISLRKPAIGDDAYVVGAPSYTRLQDTVTKGIISAHRFDRKTKQPIIQADADVHGGNSGGPLLDEYGNVIGITVSSYIDGNGSLSGLNNFIPIIDALEKLDITANKETEFKPIGLD